jgi:uncharacterized protein (DUF433 family)
MEVAVANLNKRDHQDFGRIEQKRNVNHNAAVIAGTRISVGAIKRLAEDGFSEAQILKEFPSLTGADVAAALKYSKEKHAA